MKNFLKNVLSSAIGFILASLILLITLILIVISMTLGRGETDYTIKPNSIVKIKFDYPISDKLNTDPLIFNKIGELKANNTKNLYKILNSIQIARTNENVAGIVLDLRSFQSPNLASSKEIRDALKIFKEKGKFIYSYGNYFSKTAYYLASVSDSIFMYSFSSWILCFSLGRRAEQY